MASDRGYTTGESGYMCAECEMRADRARSEANFGAKCFALSLQEAEKVRAKELEAAVMAVSRARNAQPSGAEPRPSFHPGH